MNKQRNLGRRAHFLTQKVGDQRVEEVFSFPFVLLLLFCSYVFAFFFKLKEVKGPRKRRNYLEMRHSVLEPGP